MWHLLDVPFFLGVVIALWPVNTLYQQSLNEYVADDFFTSEAGRVQGNCKYFQLEYSMRSDSTRPKPVESHWGKPPSLIRHVPSIGVPRLPRRVLGPGIGDSIAGDSFQLREVAQDDPEEFLHELWT